MIKVQPSLYLCTCVNVVCKVMQSLRFISNFVYCVFCLFLTNNFGILILIYKQDAQTESGTITVANKRKKKKEAQLWTRYLKLHFLDGTEGFSSFTPTLKYSSEITEELLWWHQTKMSCSIKCSLLSCLLCLLAGRLYQRVNKWNDKSSLSFCPFIFVLRDVDGSVWVNVCIYMWTWAAAELIQISK